MLEAVEDLACEGFDDRGRVTRGHPVIVECDLEQSVATIRCSSGAAIWKDAAPPHLVDVAVFWRGKARRMGGFGSTRWNWSSTKDTVEANPSLESTASTERDVYVRGIAAAGNGPAMASRLPRSAQIAIRSTSAKGRKTEPATRRQRVAHVEPAPGKTEMDAMANLLAEVRKVESRRGQS